MKSGFWGNYCQGIWHEIDEHEMWLRRSDNARKLGIPVAVIARFGEFPDRQKLLPFVFAEAPVMRWRCHGESVTFEFCSTEWHLSLQLAEKWCSLFAGPFLSVRMVNFCGMEVREALWKNFYDLSD